MTDNIQIQKTSVGSNEVKNLFDDTSNPNSIPMDNCNYPLEINSKINNSVNCFIPCDNMVGLGGSYLNFQQLNYGINNMTLSPNSNNNTSLCFIPSTSGSTSTCSQMMSEFNSPTMFHSMFQTSNSISSGEVDGIQNWEFGASKSSSSNINYLDHQDNHQVVEDIKWSDYMNSSPFFIGNNNTFQQQNHQTHSSIYSDSNEVKQEMGFINTNESIQSSSSTWHPHFEAANSDIYSNKDLQRFSLPFGQTLN